MGEKRLQLHSWLIGSDRPMVIGVRSPSSGNLHRKADRYLDHGISSTALSKCGSRILALARSRSHTGRHDEVRISEVLQFHGVTAPVAVVFAS